MLQKGPIPRTFKSAKTFLKAFPRKFIPSKYTRYTVIHYCTEKRKGIELKKHLQCETLLGLVRESTKKRRNKKFGECITTIRYNVMNNETTPIMWDHTHYIVYSLTCAHSSITSVTSVTRTSKAAGGVITRGIGWGTIIHILGTFVNIWDERGGWWEFG